jgi:hypothetical protein
VDPDILKIASEYVNKLEAKQVLLAQGILYGICQSAIQKGLISIEKDDLMPIISSTCVRLCNG